MAKKSKQLKQFRKTKKYGGSSRKRTPVKPKAGQEKTLKQRAEELGARIKSSAVARASHISKSRAHLKKSVKIKKPEVDVEVPISEVELAQARAERQRAQRAARAQYLAQRRERAHIAREVLDVDERPNFMEPIARP